MLKLPFNRSQVSPGWQRYRRWFRLAWLLFFGFIPGVSAIGMVLHPFFGFDVPIMVAASAWMAAWAVAASRAMGLRCPRCGLYFFSGYWFFLPYRNPFASRCVHCGLKKWSEPGSY
jgi:hypothetical protein